MAKEKRKSRKKLTKTVDITKPILPIDITKFGTDDDPCFGKLHDLTDDACKRCGDSTLCSIVLNQNTLKLRANEENNGRFKDLELAKSEPDNKEIIKFIKAKLKKGTVSVLLVKKLVQEFGISKETAKELVKKQKSK